MKVNHDRIKQFDARARTERRCYLLSFSDILNKEISGWITGGEPMWKRLSGGLCILFLAAACGGGNAPAPTAASINTNVTSAAPATSTESGAGKNATVEITGTLAQTFHSNGVYTCADPTATTSGSVNLSFMGENSQALNIHLPINALSGDYEFIDGTTQPEGNKATAELTVGRATDVYFSQSGTLTLEELGSGPNQPVMGNFEFTAAALADKTKTVTVKGTFDFMTIGAAGTGGDLSQYYCGDK
jgi:hypothetical protein